MDDDEVISVNGNDCKMNEIRVIPRMNDKVVMEAHKADVRIAKIMSQLNQGNRVGKYCICEGKLVKYSKDGNGILVIPRSLVKVVLEGVHDMNGH